MKDLWLHLKETNKPIALYGTGNGADKILDKLILDGTVSKVQGVFASSGFVRNKLFRGYQIESYEDVKERLGDMIVLMCFGSSRPEVLENVQRIKSENEFYAPDVPVYGNTIFDYSFYENNKSLFDEVRNILSDDLSVKTFDDLIKFKLTGDISYIYDCAVEADEADSLIKLLPGASFMDLGAYNGDTIHRYTSMFSQIESSIAVEPDSRNFKKLINNTSNMNIRYINGIITDTEGQTLIPDKKGGRGVSENIEGKISIATYTIDGILKDQKVDFIKFDVEGNELKAITGGEKTLKKYMPKMLVSCYHRSEDLFELPLKVQRINPSYKIYLRQLKHIPAWDTAFYFI